MADLVVVEKPPEEAPEREIGRVIPEEERKLLARIDASAASVQTKAALVLAVRQGKSWKEASNAVGVNHHHVWKWAKRLDLTGAHNKALAQQARELVALTGEELERRLVNPLELERMPTKELVNVHEKLSATAVKLDGLSQEGPAEDSFVRRITAAVERIVALGGVTVTVEPAAKVIDVQALPGQNATPS